MCSSLECDQMVIKAGADQTDEYIMRDGRQEAAGPMNQPVISVVTTAPGRRGRQN